jgi:hypothetical protein
MRPLRVAVIGVLVAAGLVAWVPGANASASSASKTCQSLTTLNKNLEKAFPSGNSGHLDTGAIENLSKSFRKAEKGSPASLKAAESTIADVAANVSHTGSTAAAAAALKAGGTKLTTALATWEGYIAKCSGAIPTTT